MKHIALELCNDVFENLFDEHIISDDTIQPWLTNFPALESITLMFDPGNVAMRQRGTVVLYEPKDVPVQNCRRMKPSQVVQQVTSHLKNKLEEYEGLFGFEDGPPTIECAVMCWKRSKKTRSG